MILRKIVNCRCTERRLRIQRANKQRRISNESTKRSRLPNSHPDVLRILFKCISNTYLNTLSKKYLNSNKNTF